ncbi:MAG: SoxR reducing system RseC family protein [Elusimicrobia bacterium]|jgi:positive regulator of sigma E activity|nr:SoxR reducing system RseC family protein [Elusimicrobiota bacterium]
MSSKETVKIRGRITDISHLSIKVTINNASECSDCNICSGPGGRSVTVPYSKGFNEKEFNEGENVSVNIPCSLLSGISFLIYFIPALFLLAGFIAGYTAGGNLTAVISALCSLAISYIIVKVITFNRLKNFIDITHVES